MKVTRRAAVLTGIGALLGGGGLYALVYRPPTAASVRARIATPLPALQGPLNVFHLGHSLVNRDMPAMLAQLAPPGHRYDSQLGWGTTLQSHWGDAPINGFDTENAHPRFRSAHEAVESGDYDAIVLTEMVEIRDSVRYFDSPRYLAQWADKAVAARPDVRLYLYETWHRLDDPEGWLERLDRDLDRYWLSRVLGPALKTLPTALIHIIPAGQVLASFVRAVESQGGIGRLRSREDLFPRSAAGVIDPIHLNDLGNYLVALVHYAVLYQRSPIGLPHALNRADGTPADAPEPEVARLMQEITWATLRRLGVSGLSA
ncbi:MAG TPA: hypothetical protein VK146_16590 [Tabrizicola sp.]|nr:hypothetical protein [Tabrizicola sp.]